MQVLFAMVIALLTHPVANASIDPAAEHAASAPADEITIPGEFEKGESAQYLVTV